MAYWLGALRGVSTNTVVSILWVPATLLVVASGLVHRWAEGAAHRSGLLDMQTMH